MNIADIQSRGKLPIIVGGTGLYIQSVIYDYQFSEAPSDPVIVTDSKNRVAEEGIEHVFAELKEVDPESAERIHPNNVRSVIQCT